MLAGFVDGPLGPFKDATSIVLETHRRTFKREVIRMIPSDRIDVVPAADRREQQTPLTLDPRAAHEHSLDRPIADVLEQEIPIGDAALSPGIDDERVEPLDDTEWREESGLISSQGDTWGR